jgi:hypothetical protein
MIRKLFKPKRRSRVEDKMLHHFRRLNPASITRQTFLELLFVVLMTTTMFGADSIGGDWQGTLDTGSQKLRLVLHVTGDQKVGWKATVDSLDQTSTGMTVDKISISKSALSFEMSRLLANFTGKWDPKENAYVGTWSQENNSLPLTFHKVQKTEDRKP